MRRRILVAASSAPGTGGGSTLAYACFRWLRRAPFDVSYLTMIEEQDEDWLAYTCGPDFRNPEGLDDVHCHVVRDDEGRADLVESVARLAPDVVVAFGAEACARLAGAWQGCRTVLLASGFELLERRRSERCLGDLLRAIDRGRRVVAQPGQRLREAAAAADLIVAPAHSARQLHAFFLPAWTGKLHPDVVGAAAWIRGGVSRHVDLARSWTDRDIDVLFAAARWQPPEKGHRLLGSILPGLRGLNPVVVGEAPREFPGARYAGLVPDRRQYLALLGRTKVVVCPSRFETSSSVLFEASAMGCNVVASGGCGDWTLCHPELRVEKASAREFVEKIQRAVLAKVEDRIGDFIRPDANEGLLETLEVL